MVQSRTPALFKGRAASVIASICIFASNAYGDPLAVTEVAPGVFVHRGTVAVFNPQNRGDVANVGFVVGRDAVAVIDSGGAAKIGAALREAITKITAKPIRYVINTHMHPDHVLGNAAFEADAPQFVGHKKLARGLAARAERYTAANRELMGEDAFAGSRIVMPTLAVEDRRDIDLGGRVLTLVARPTAHTDNDLTVLDKETGTLFLGDLLFSGHVPALDGSLKGWMALLDELQTQNYARVVPGHGPAAMPWPDAMKPLMRYLATLATDVRAAVKAGRTLSDATRTAAQSERQSWELFDDFNARNASAAFHEMEWE